MKEKVLDLCKGGQAKTYYSVDTVKDGSDDDGTHFPEEFLHSLTPSGMPLHATRVKEGSVIVLLRNITLNGNLCNGTRLIVKKILQHSLVCALLDDVKTAAQAVQLKPERDVIIPRIRLHPSDNDLPFVMERLQLPIRLAYAMTINKAQGQTFDKVGILLTRPVFTHGQLYVAFSRVRSKKNIVVQLPPEAGGITANIAFKEILQ